MISRTRVENGHPNSAHLVQSCFSSVTYPRLCIFDPFLGHTSHIALINQYQTCLFREGGSKNVRLTYEGLRLREQTVGVSGRKEIASRTHCTCMSLGATHAAPYRGICMGYAVQCKYPNQSIAKKKKNLKERGSVPFHSLKVWDPIRKIQCALFGVVQHVFGD